MEGSIYPEILAVPAARRLPCEKGRAAPGGDESAPTRIVVVGRPAPVSIYVIFLCMW